MYKSMLKLQKMLKKANVPHEFREVYDGFQIRVFLKNEEILSAVQHNFSYGNEQDLIEIMGGLTEEESKYDSVLGHLTAEEVFKRFEYCWENNTGIYNE